MAAGVARRLAAPVTAGLAAATAATLALQVVLGWGGRPDGGDYGMLSLPLDLVTGDVCPSPKTLLKAGTVLATLLAPALVNIAVGSLLAHAARLATLWAVERTARMAAGAARQASIIQTMAAAYGLTLVVWAALGHLLSRGVGWAAPSLFMSDAAHECGTGLCAPLLATSLGLLPWTVDQMQSPVPGPSARIRVAAWVPHSLAYFAFCAWRQSSWATLAAVLVGVPLAGMVHEARRRQSGAGGLLPQATMQASGGRTSPGAAQRRSVLGPLLVLAGGGTQHRRRRSGRCRAQY